MRAADLISATLILLFIICCSVLFTTHADSVVRTFDHGITSVPQTGHTVQETLSLRHLIVAKYIFYIARNIRRKPCPILIIQPHCIRTLNNNLFCM